MRFLVRHRLITLVTLILVWGNLSRAGWVEQRGDSTVIHIKVFQLPDPTRGDTPTRADVAVVREFVRRFPEIFAERYRDKYKRQPEVYGDNNWDHVEVELHTFTGITIPHISLDARPLMAIAAGLAPDILYVNFRQSDTYIQQGFLYPLDKPDDSYITALTQEELEFRIHPKIWPVIRRKGPNGQMHVWAMPYGGALGKVVLFRKDLFDAAGVPYPSSDWTWDDLISICRRVSDPSRGIYALGLGRGLHESWYWLSFLWSAGGEVLVYEEETDHWTAVFNSPEAVEALDFYTRLNTEPWTDRHGRVRYGYTYKEPDKNIKWERGELAMIFEYIDEKIFATINPDLTGMVPVPRGPTGLRGAELNSRMMGLFSGIQHPAVRDAAWEYIRFFTSDEAMRIRVQILVEGGLGRFINPKYLERYGYKELVRLTPKEWQDCFEIAIETGRPEPYGRNCQLVYNLMTEPLQEAEQMALRKALPVDPGLRRQILKKLLDRAVERTNRKMLGQLSARELLRNRITGSVFLLLLGGALAWAFMRISFVGRELRARDAADVSDERILGKQKYVRLALLLPAVLTILIWRYWPLLHGTWIAFLDYRILGKSRWVGVDNFGSVLWDTEWWACVLNSVRYSLWTVSLTFLPPFFLAVALHEIPKGKVLFRTLFYLPAVLSSLLVTLLWRSFYDPTETGALNALILRIPAWVYAVSGFAVLFAFIRLATRLWYHNKRGIAILIALVGAGAAYAVYRVAAFAWAPYQTWNEKLMARISDPVRWLQDSKTAMFACVLPHLWAGLGPGSLIYLAALKTIPEELYEVADLDGATLTDKLLFIVLPCLRPLLLINFLGVFIHAWLHGAGHILAMTGGTAGTEVADLHIFYQAFLFLRFGPAAAMAWILGFLLIGFTAQQLHMLSRVEFRKAPTEEQSP